MQAYVNYTSASRSLSALKQSAGSLSLVIPNVQSIYRELNVCTGIGRGVKVELERVLKDIENHSANIISLYNTGNQAISEYRNCESILAGKDIPADGSNSLAISALNKSVNSSYEIDWGPLRKIAGEYGVVGSLFSSAWSMSDGGSAAWVGGVKIFEKAANTIQKFSNGDEISWFGFLKSAPDSLKDQLNKYVYDPSKCKTVAAKNASKFGVAAKWVGLAFSGMINFVENFEEYDADFSNPRLYAETIGETAVDVGFGMFVGAGVAALAGATAPVWAVGVVSTGVVLGANWVSEKVFGKDVAELVSDTVLDSAEAVGKLVRETTKKVGNAIHTTAKNISAGWKKIKSWF